MPERVYIGNYAKGLKLDRLPFNIDNDAFPTMYNFYSWRGRAKRKRGTGFLGILQVQLELVASISNPWEIIGPSLTADSVNLISSLSLGDTASITPQTINLTVGANTYTEPSPPDGTLIGTPAGSGNINYATGDLTISGGGSGQVTGTFSYYPGLPVMGLRDFVSSSSSTYYPLLLSFDTLHSYQFNQVNRNFYDVNYYKTTEVPFLWSGQDFQLFWTTNFQGALWATNNKPGFNFLTASYTSGSGTTAVTFNFKSAGVNFTTLVIGDVLWFNELTGTINGVSGTVSDITDAANGNYVVTFTSTVTVSGTGIAQMMTNTIPGQDGIKWYDGDPTAGTGIPTGSGKGWVNFSPPLTAATVSIDDNPPALYYLVGALSIVAFKDRLLFLSPYIQTSSGAPIQLVDTIILSWNGTPYYSSPVPANQTFDVSAYYIDQTGRGGWQSAGTSQPITTVTNNEDVLLIGFADRQTRFVYTGNDLYPFTFFSINSELGAASPFSAITLDRGGLTIGTRGLVLTTQQSSQRVDLDIPDTIFQIQALNDGVLRVNSVRDFFKEWIYFSYPTDYSNYKYPTSTLLYNYRDNTWAIMYENFTAQGTYRNNESYTWATLPYTTWNAWREPWNSGASAAFFPSIVGGNPQGYVLIKSLGTGESPSGTIMAISDNAGNTQITSINHCVMIGDYLYILGCLGTTSINTQIGKVISVQDDDNFTLDIDFPAGTYLGMGTYTRLSQPLVQTKQFPIYWDQGRQTRLLEQKYLLDRTAQAQITANIYLSQDPDTAWNSGTIVPIIDPEPSNSSLIYSQLVYTCPESTNIGLTPANTNLQTPTASSQFQIWHRMNTSLIGESVQIGLTLNDSQMRNLDYATAEISLHGMQLTFEKGPLLA